MENFRKIKKLSEKQMEKQYALSEMQFKRKAAHKDSKEQSR